MAIQGTTTTDSENMVEASAATGRKGGSSRRDPQHSHRPTDMALTQQRMKAWQPLLDPKWVITCYLLIGLIFIPTGIVIRQKSKNLIEVKAIYESYLKKGPPANVAGCEIGNNPNAMYLDGGRTCQIQMRIPFDKGDLEPPVLIHYELDNFYQNYRKYQMSLDQYQLLGRLASQQDVTTASYCAPLNKVGDTYINPCGFIANTFFNDVFTLESIVKPDGTVLENAPMVETGIAWESDMRWKFAQPEGFTAEQCPSCEEAECDCNALNEKGERAWSCEQPYTDEDGNCWRYYYPEDDITQYLYETYPMMIDPLEGVTNEHFVVWMRVAALPHFRKLYGYIEQTIPAGSVLTFNVMANWAVERIEGSKALVVSNSYIFGGKNHWLGTLFIVVGSIAAILGLFFLVKDYFKPRRIGDKMCLRYKED